MSNKHGGELLLEKRKNKSNNNPVENILKLAKIYKNESMGEIKKNKDIEYEDIKIEVNYKNDLNILKIHGKIVGWFNWRENMYCEKLKKLVDCEKNRKDFQNIIQKKKSLKVLKKYEELLERISSGVEYREYLRRSKEYLDEYKKIGSLPEIISFENKIREETDLIIENSDDKIRRYNIITKYLDIVQEYVPVEFVRQVEIINGCSACGCSSEELTENAFGNIICNQCGTEEISIKKTPYQKDKTMICGIRNNYEDRENFKKAIKRFQGTQNNKPPKSLYSELDEYFKNKNFPIGDDVRLNNTSDQNTSRNLMYKALADTGNSEYYEDINLILHQYWGWELPDIAHIEENIMDDYDLTQTIYEELPKIRKSSLNSQFRLLKHLLRYKDKIIYEINVKDFKIPTTREIIEWHEETWTKICQILTLRGYPDWYNVPIL